MTRFCLRPHARWNKLFRFGRTVVCRDERYVKRSLVRVPQLPTQSLSLYFPPSSSLSFDARSARDAFHCPLVLGVQHILRD